MAEKVVQFHFGAVAVYVTIGATIHRSELYGKQVRTREKDGVALQEVLLDPEGQIFLPSAFAHLQTDSEGSLAETPLVQTVDGEMLDLKLSSFKEARPLEPATIQDLLSLRVSAVLPARCDLAPGLYKSTWTYRDSHQLKQAVLNITAAGDGFLLTGDLVESPLQGKPDVYSFFTADEDAEESDPDDLSMQMW